MKQGTVTTPQPEEYLAFGYYSRAREKLVAALRVAHEGTEAKRVLEAELFYVVQCLEIVQRKVKGYV